MGKITRSQGLITQRCPLHRPQILGPLAGCWSSSQFHLHPENSDVGTVPDQRNHRFGGRRGWGGAPRVRPWGRQSCPGEPVCGPGESPDHCCREASTTGPLGASWRYKYLNLPKAKDPVLGSGLNPQSSKWAQLSPWHLCAVAQGTFW